MYVILFVLILLSVIYLYLKHELNYWNAREVPHAKGTFFVGNFGDTVLMRRATTDIYCDLYKKFKGYKYCGFFNFRKPSLLLIDLDLIKDVLIKNFNNFHDSPLIVDKKNDPILSKNPFFARGQEWKLIRAQLTPQFTIGKVKAMYPLMEQVGKNLVTYLNTEPAAVGPDGLNAKDLANKFTADCVASCAFGLDGQSFSDPNAEFLNMGKDLFKTSYVDIMLFLLGDILPEFRKIRPPTFLRKDISDRFRNIILTNLRHREADGINRGDYLDVILELKKTTTTFDFTTDYMIAHAMSFFLDGFETSSVLMQYVYYELGANLDVQTKLREEIERVLLENDGKLTFDALQDMKYLDMVMQETLRKYPPVTITMRECTETITLEPARTGGKSLSVKKGTPIIIPVMAIHYDPEYFPDPEKFIPERFSEKLQEKFSYLPFGEGPRMCLGRRFGIAQIQVGILETVRHFEIRVNKKTKVPFELEPTEFLHAVKGGVWINFHKLNKS